MKTIRCLLALTLVAFLGFGSTGCNPRFAGRLVGAAIATTAIVGTAMVLAHHDAHFHHADCGCPREFHGGQWVYFYGGGWEYHHQGVWYRYGHHHQHH